MSFTSSVSSGMYIVDEILFANETQTIYAGGFTSSIEIMSDGVQNVSSGGIANSTYVNYDGTMNIFTGGRGLNATINDHGVLFVYSGGHASRAKINSGGYMQLAAGGTATIIDQQSGGVLATNTSATITGGVNARTDGHSNFSIVNGVASNFIMNSGGSLSILSGHSAVNTIVNQMGGYELVESGGVAYSTIINEGYQNVSSGGYVLNATVNSSGYMWLNGGTANSTTINSGGSATVSSGAKASNTTIGSGGFMNIISGGSAIGVNQLAGGTIKATTGATVTGGVNARTDGHSNFSIVNGVASNFIMNSGGSLSILSGHSAVNTIVNQMGGYELVESGGVAYSTIINEGYQNVSSGGYVLNATVNSSGYMWLNGGTANSTTINSGGSATVSSGAKASNTTISFSGFMGVISGGYADNTVINRGGSMHISSGGYADNTIIYSSGSMTISSGGVAAGINQFAGGVINANTGATITDGNNESGTFNISNGIASNIIGGIDVESGHSALNTIVYTDMHISSGGYADNTVINYWGAMNISSGGVAAGIDQLAGGVLNANTGATITGGNNESGTFNISNGIASNIIGGIDVESGHSALNTIVYTDMHISSGGYSDNTVINSRGSMTISFGGYADNTIINSSGSMNISSGGVAVGIDQLAGGVLNANTGATITGGNNESGTFNISNGIASNIIGGIDVESGHSALNTIVYTDMHISSGGYSDNTVINSRGSMTISSGGYSDNTVINSRGSMTISFGGYADNTIINSSGSMNISSGGVATGINQLKGGIINTNTGATITGGVNARTDGYSNFSIVDGIAENILIESGCFTVFSGHSANNIFVGQEGYHDDGYVVDIIPGFLYIQSGGVARDTVLDYFGILSVSSGGTTFNTNISGGREEVDFGAVADSTIINSGGLQSVYGIATATTVNESGSQNVYGIATATMVNENGGQVIHSGGVASGTTISGGWVFENGDAQFLRGSQTIYAGGSAIDTVINGGVQRVFGNVTNVTNSTGILYIESGGQLGGLLQVNNGSVLTSSTVTLSQATDQIDLTGYAHLGSADIAITGGGDVNVSWVHNIAGNITISGGGALNFNITEFAEPNAEVMLTDITDITTDVFTVTMDSSHNIGSYMLAGNAAGFNDTITVYDDGNIWGTVSLENNLIDGNTVCSLSIVDDKLAFNLTEDVTPPSVPTGLTFVIQNNSILLDWDDSFDPVSGIKEYQIQYADNDQFTSATSQIVAASELDLTSLAEGTYYWRVKAVDNADNESGWSTTDSFQVFNPSETKLLASDGAAGDRYGHVDMDGDTIVVGSFYSDSPAVDSGSIYVYKWNGTSYDETKLVASDGVTTDFMGSDVAISGSTIVVGVYGDDDSGADSGSAYIYKWNGTDYDETKIIASDGGDGVGQDFFGISVAIDGDTIVTGAMWDDDNGESSGSAYVYKWNGTSYGEIKLTASDGAAADYYGGDVAIDGDTVVVGSWHDDDDGTNSGSIYVYKWNGTSYDETKITASDGATYDYFGKAVAIDGDVIAVGSYQDDDNGIDSGSAYVYRWNGTGYDEYKINASDGTADDLFGFSIDVQGDLIVVGAYRGDDNGSVYLFEWNGTSYQEKVKISASDGAVDDGFGVSVALSGNKLTVGSHYDDDNGDGSGSAYVYSFGAPGVPIGLTDSVTGSSASLDWFNVADNLSGLKEYVVEYADNDTFTDSTSQSVTVSELDLSDLAAGTYYWRVKSVDNNDNASDWSDEKTFEVSTLPYTSIVSSGMHVSNENIINGTQTVLNSGMTTSQSINSGGSQSVYSGGIVENTTINDDGIQDIYEGGIAESTTVNSGGMQEVNIRGSAHNTDINSGGIQTVSYDGFVQYIDINGGMQIITGGEAYNTQLFDDSLQVIEDFGIAGYTTVNSGGMQEVNIGGSAHNTDINSGGRQVVSSGGSAYNTDNDGGTQEILTGGFADYVNIGYNGYSFVDDGAEMNYVYIEEGFLQVRGNVSDVFIDLGVLYIESGGQISGCLQVIGGRVEADSLVTMSQATDQIDLMGYTDLSSSEIEITGGGNVNVSWVQNIAGNITISGGGALNFNITEFAEPNAEVMLTDITDITTDVFTVTMDSSHNIGSYILAGNATDFNDAITVYDDGNIWGTVSLENNLIDGNTVCSLSIVDDKLAFNITEDVTPPSVPTGLTFIIQDNSILLDWDDSIDTSSGIKEYYIRYSKSYASDVQMPQTETVTASEFEIDGLDNAIYSWSVKAVDYAGNESDWSDTEVYYYDTEVPDAPVGLTGVVTDNGVALDWDDSFDPVSGIKEYQIQYADNDQFTSATSQIVAASELDLTSLAEGTYYWRVKAVDNADNESEWSMTKSFIVSTLSYTPIVSSGMHVSNENIINGTQTVLNSGMTTSQSINSGGSQSVYSGGIVENTTINDDGIQDIYEGGIAESTTVNSGGMQEVNIRGSANNTDINSGGIQTVSYDGFVQYIDINGGMQIITGGDAYNTQLFDDSLQVIEDFGVAEYTTVNDGGTQEVHIGGAAYNTDINLGGRQVVSSGGSAYDTNIDGGTQEILTGGFANYVYIGFNGYSFVDAGAEMNDVEIEEGFLHVRGNVSNVFSNAGILYFESGGQISGYWGVIDGRVETDSLVTMSQATDQIDLMGYTDLSSAEVAITGGGNVNVSWVQNIAGNITISGGGALNFIITEFAEPNTEVMLTDITDITTDAITVTMDSSHNAGSYILAGNATDFNDTITVYDDGNIWGTVSLENNLIDGNTVWSLSIVDDKLAFNLTEDVTPPSVPTGLAFVIQNNSILLDWDDSIDTSSGIKEYYIRYSKSYASDVQMPQTETVTASEFEIDGLDNAIYSWSVKAVDYAGNESDWSDTEVYYYDTEVPDAPVGLTGVVTDNGVALDWDDSFDSVSGIKEYIVVYSANTDMTDATEITVAASELDLTGMADGTWYWRVKSVDNADNESVWSTTDSFIIDFPDTQAPSVPNGLVDSVNGSSASLDWNDSTDDKSGIKEYVVEYADNDQFTSAVSQTVIASELDLSSLTDGTYYWRVKAVDNADNESAWSLINSFGTMPDGVTKITASDGAAEDDFGYSVSIYGDNVVIGGRYDDDNGNYSGSVYVYCWNSITGTYNETKLNSSDGAENDWFGESVAISSNTVVAGAHGDDDNGYFSGSAYVYRWNGISYDEYKLTASDGASEDYFGISVSIFGDTVVVGATQDDDNGSNSGSAYVYRWNGTSYDEYKLTASDGAIFDEFGNSVSISDDVVVVGAYCDDDNGTVSGSAYVYRWNDATSVYDEYKLIASDGAVGDHFGRSVAVSGDTVVVGTSEDDDKGNDSGSVYVYRWNDTISAYDEYKLTASDGISYDNFGTSVAIDGDYVVIGARGTDNNGDYAGSVYVYRWNGTGYDEYKFHAPDGASYDYFGQSVSISGDIVVVGAYGDDDNGSDSGSAYIFDLNEFIDLTAPDVPTGLTDSVTNDSASLDWADSEDNVGGDGLKEYVVEYADNDQFTSAISQTVAISELDLSGLTDMTTFYWRVKAVDNSGNESGWSGIESFSIDIPDTNAPDQPDGLTSLISGNSISLDWADAADNKSGIKEYIVEYADNDVFTGATSQSSASSSINLTELPDGNYYWRVKTVDNAGNESAWSETSSFMIDITVPEVPFDLASGVNGNDIALDWDDANNNYSGMQGYVVQYADNTGFSGHNSFNVVDSELDLNDLADGVYYWRVQSVDNNGNESGWSQVDSFVVDTTAPDAPSGLDQTITGNDIALDWNDALDNLTGISAYIVEYGLAQNFSGATSATSTISNLALTDLADGVYHWRVKAIDNNGNESGWIESQFELDTTVPSSPSELRENIDGVTAVLQWTASIDEFSDINGYIIEYADNLNFDNSFLIQTVDCELVLNDLTYGTWFWRVKAGDSFDNWSEWSTSESFDTGDTSGNTHDQAKLINVDEAYHYDEYVGQGDPCDMYCFDVDSPGEFDLALTNLSAKTKVALYTWDGKKYKKLKGANSRLDRTTGLIEVHIDNLMLDEDTYYVEVLSGDKGRGKCNTDYTLDITPGYFPDATDNNSWQNATEITPEIQLDGFVGFGDASDFYKFEVDSLTSFDIDLTGSGKNAKLNVYEWNEAKGKLKKLKSAKLKYGEASLDNLSLDAGLYYVEVLSADKGKGKKNTEYELDITQSIG